MNQEISLTREVDAIQIPSGDTISLPAGTPVVITQSLGGHLGRPRPDFVQ